VTSFPASGIESTYIYWVINLSHSYLYLEFFFFFFFLSLYAFPPKGALGYEAARILGVPTVIFYIMEYIITTVPVHEPRQSIKFTLKQKSKSTYDTYESESLPSSSLAPDLAAIKGHNWELEGVGHTVPTKL